MTQQLYKLDRGSRFKLTSMPQTPPDSLEVETDEIYRLVKLDGMYCWCKDGDNQDHYFAAWTEVTPMEEL
jgi:hypothetical protein